MVEARAIPKARSPDASEPAMQQELSATRQTQSGSSFRLEEATIAELHRAICAGETTCVEVVRHYLARVRAFNGVASALVTEDGAPVPEATGAVRAGSPLRFPRDTIKAATFLPDLDQYRGWKRPRPTLPCSSSSA
jgi:hypothetical protein